MKRIYISDMDGTLLNNDATLSGYAERELNKLIENGLNFTVATARTHLSAMNILCNVNLEYPIIVMNGACIYNIKNKIFESVSSIGKNSFKKLIEIIKRFNLFGVMFAVSNDEFNVYHQKICNEEMQLYIEQRKKYYNYNYIEIDFANLFDKNIVYYSFNGTREATEKASIELKKIQGLNVEYYVDTYTNKMYLEVSSNKASKYHAALKLKSLYGFGEIVAFGDNYNDIPLFEASNHGYAVENARQELKNIATAIIPSNEEYGVVKFLKNKFEN